MAAGSLEAYAQIAGETREALLEAETEWLRTWGANLVVSDIVPLACAAAAEADVRCVCVSNFSWGIPPPQIFLLVVLGGAVRAHTHTRTNIHARTHAHARAPAQTFIKRL